ncbi:MAG TPA: GNAT family N-acetyltransferase [bacterium]|nr:GNAT family N-acetyltransferase [bacterium]HPN44586.1 GNAT family N-acetyltransferase [bacterium]
MLITLHPLSPAEQDFIWAMLYLAIYTPPGSAPLPPEIVQQPDIAKYATGWGKSTDLGLYARNMQSGQMIGAAWLRLFKYTDPGYGYVDDTTPELSMAVLPDFRGQGIGNRLLTELLNLAEKRFPAVSLSVATSNPAVLLYKKFGFVTAKLDEHSLVMLKNFAGPASQ